MNRNGLKQVINVVVCGDNALFCGDVEEVVQGIVGR